MVVFMWNSSIEFVQQKHENHYGSRIDKHIGMILALVVQQSNGHYHKGWNEQFFHGKILIFKFKNTEYQFAIIEN